jgi:D-arabinose 1-dehydrogenase-like Zn-dependent alcohol dehydrogenase
MPDEGYPKLGIFDLLGKSIGGSMMGAPQDQRDMLALAVDKNIQVWYEERPMKDINQALDGELVVVKSATETDVLDFRQGKPRYRYVLVNGNI